jgi:hypothetical protein
MRTADQTEYVVNNGGAVSTKAGLIAPGEAITRANIASSDRFYLLLERGRIIEKSNYKPKTKAVQNGRIYIPENVVIPFESDQAIIDYIKTMEIPASQREAWSDNILIINAREEYQLIYSRLQNLGLNANCRTTQAHNAALKYLDSIQESFKIKQIRL